MLCFFFFSFYYSNRTNSMVGIKINDIQSADEIQALCMYSFKFSFRIFSFTYSFMVIHSIFRATDQFGKVVFRTATPQYIRFNFIYLSEDTKNKKIKMQMIIHVLCTPFFFFFFFIVVFLANHSHHDLFEIYKVL